MDTQYILDRLPFAPPFLFVDTIAHIDADGVVGCYTFSADSAFYQGHFKNHPVTPGVLLTECCAQIGLVCLGIFLLGEGGTSNLQLGLSSSEMEFLRPVFPGEKVKVVSEKTYFRFQKLKCRVKMYNADDILVCQGDIAGMFKKTTDGE